MTTRQVKIARAIALLADLVQITIFPYFGWGGIVPLNAAIEVALCFTFWSLIGWHIAFLPSFLIEMTPLLTLAPTWSIAVMIATRGHQNQPAHPAAASKATPASAQTIDV